MTRACFCAIVPILLLCTFAHGGAIEGFTPSGAFDEQQKTWTTEDGVRVLINAGGDFDATKPTHLVLFALPNGNTIEWTWGGTLEPGMDWHYDIQHVGAQTRQLRSITKDENIVVALLEANTKSWPAWRKAHPDNGTRIRDLVAQVSRTVSGPESSKHLTLTCHSGGGSLIFGYLNGGDAIGDNVTRIAWLDANYAYDDADKHGDKLLAWLKADKSRHMIVIAYDDSQITLAGKPVLKSPMGGTFGSSQRMIERFGKDVELTKSTRGPFEVTVGMNGQAQFLVHGNPEKKILHTVLVERNGLLEALTLGTPLAAKWGGEFWGDRAYAKFVGPTMPSTQPATKPVATKTSGLPPRPDGAKGGKFFAESVADLPPKAREIAIEQEVLRGNVPDFMRKFVPITVTFTSPDGAKYEATYEVSPDYLCVGSDADFFRVPLTPATATRIAAALGCSLSTRKIADDVYANAVVKLEPQPLGPPREAVETFMKHNAMIEEQRGGKPPGELIAGIKKDVVISNRLKEKPNKIAIYGWHKPDGKPIQPLYVGHVDWYVDYSHGIRLVKREMTVDGKRADLEDVMKDPNLCGAVSDEGPIVSGAATYESK